MLTNLKPIILSGGCGSRLWPLSRTAYPKHLIDLIGDESLFEKTIKRAQSVSSTKTQVICNHDQRFLIAEQLQGVGEIVLEPCGRNTAPAIAVAALMAQPDNLLLIMPADHLINDEKAFSKAVKQASSLAQSGKLVTFGVLPTSAHTGYGYIQKGQAIEGAFEVDQFVEKPDLKTAQSYVDSGDYDWNAGLFLFKASAYLDALNQYHPDILMHATAAIEAGASDLDFYRLDEKAFAQCDNISIDYAVMEKTDQAVVVPLGSAWSDVGSWDALDALSPKDANNNTLVGDVITENTQNCYIRSNSNLIAAVGVSDHIIIDTDDAVLVAHKSHAQDVKKIVEALASSERPERLHHQTEYRPWGQHRLLIEGSGFQVREVKVMPHAAMREQMHQKRSEHWVIVEGVAKVKCDDLVKTIGQNESFYVPAGSKHLISNNSDALLVFIEVQVGDCLREDDTERF